MINKFRRYGLLQIVAGTFIMGWLCARTFETMLPAILAAAVILGCNVLAYRTSMSYKEDEETSTTGM